MIDLVTFTTDPARARAVMDAGADAVLVDWEQIGKWDRQQGADTEINEHGVEELRRIRDAIDGHLICRVNGDHAGSAEEIDLAIANGANELLLPMARSLDEIRRFLGHIDGRCDAGVLIETSAAVNLADAIGQLPLRRVYVGLNDLMIDRAGRFLFDAVADGTVDGLRPFLPMHFGFGGLTVPEGGAPIPCRLLLGELARLRCGFTFLRRSFWRDTANRDLAREIARIREAIDEAFARDPEAVARDSAQFRLIVDGIAAAR